MECVKIFMSYDHNVYLNKVLIMELITLFGAVIAAVAASLNLWKSFKDDTDSIYVKTGTFQPTATLAKAFYVVNTGKHPVMLSDYGFVLEDGKLFSIPWYDENDAISDGPDLHAFHSGSTTIPQRDLFSVGITFNEKIIGSYAVTVTQSIYRVHMIRTRFYPRVLFQWIFASLKPRYGN
jgi:hypothetical protein